MQIDGVCRPVKHEEVAVQVGLAVRYRSKHTHGTPLEHRGDPRIILHSAILTAHCSAT
jgi:hypothetical protein